MKRNRQVVKTFVNGLDIEDRLSPRDAFYGGRTNATKLYHKVDENQQILYNDFTSLYPSTQKLCRYPVGAPRIITQNFGPIGEYFGLIKCKVLPPRKLYHPVLPYRFDGKLVFPLCKKCTDTVHRGKCNCTINERCITGTWCTAEVQKAVEKGYVVKQIYEVYPWDETTQYDSKSQSGGLFARYVNTFLKFKQESSGWPSWCQSEQDRDQYVRDYFNHEGIQLDPEFIKENKGLRALAKLCLNSFWGKFGKRTNMSKHILITEASEFYRILTNPSRRLIDWHIMNESYVLLEWQHAATFLPEHKTTNIFIAAFTTTYARLKLYNVLDSLGERVLYFGTDSVIYIAEPNKYCPPLGDYLGDLTDELKGNHIVEFVSCGPKHYGYLTSDGSVCCKVKGFRLDYATAAKVNFNTMCDQLFLWYFDLGKQNIRVTNQQKICRNKFTAKIYNRVEDKRYRVVYSKRTLQADFSTLPFGYH